MILSSFLKRYATISITKLALLFNRSVILIFCYQWTDTNSFALLAATISLVEILRVLNDIGAESVLYAKIYGPHQNISRLARSLIQVRLIASFLITLLIFFIGWILDTPTYLFPLLLIPMLSTLQNTCFYLLQKHKHYKNIIRINTATFLLCSISILYSLMMHAQGLMLSILIVSGDMIALGLALIFVNMGLMDIVTTKIRKLNTLQRLKNMLLPSFVVGVLVIFYSRLDVTMVLPLLGSAKQAEFSYAFRLVEPLFLLLGIGTFALLAELGATNRKNISAYYNLLSTKLRIDSFFSISVFSLLLGTLLSLFIIKILKLSVDTPLILILSSLIFLRLSNSIQSAFLQRLGRFDIVCNAAIITFIITFVLGYVLSVTYSLIGVGASILFAELCNMVYQITRLKKIISNEHCGS